MSDTCKDMSILRDKVTNVQVCQSQNMVTDDTFNVMVKLDVMMMESCKISQKYKTWQRNKKQTVFLLYSPLLLFFYYFIVPFFFLV